MHTGGTFEQDLYMLPNISKKAVVNFPMHYHRHFEVLMLTKGKTEMEVGGIRQEVNVGDVVFISPYVPHSYICGDNEESERLIIVFEPESFGLLGETLIKYIPSNPFLKREQVEATFPDITERLDAAHLLFRQSELYELPQKLPMLAKTYAILSDLLSLCVLESADKMNNDTYLKAVKLCCDNFSDENFYIANICDSLSVSQSKIQKLFAQNMEMGVKEYINHLRIGNAEKLLRASELPISEIALSSGFGTIRTFNRAFLRLKGKTPGEIRDAERKKRRNG